jgi:hypothetical protein
VRKGLRAAEAARRAAVMRDFFVPRVAAASFVRVMGKSRPPRERVYWHNAYGFDPRNRAPPLPSKSRIRDDFKIRESEGIDK